MTKNIFLWLLAALLCTGCATVQSAVDSIRDEIAQTGSLETVQAEIDENLQAQYARAAAMVDKEYAVNAGNILFSPISLEMALGMVAEGAEGHTKAQLNAYLETEDYGRKAERIMQSAKERFAAGEGEESTDTITLEFANSIWLNEKYELQAEYKNTLKNTYDAQAEKVSFALTDAEATAERINGWCKEKTHEMIPQIVKEENLSEGTNSILINTVYFESPWYDPWYDISDLGLKFTNVDGLQVETEFISTGSLYGYYETDEAVAFEAAYRKGIVFYGILPKEEGDFQLSDIDVAELLASEKTGYDELHAKMPKLNYETTMRNIIDTLEEDGVTDVFDGKVSRLNKMVDLEEEQTLAISGIIQKCRMELDENGTKAAAATEIEIAPEAAPDWKEPMVVEVVLDRPYAFMIFDQEAQEILFLGKVVAF